MAACPGCERACFRRWSDDVQEYRIAILHACDGTITFDSDLIGLATTYNLIGACEIAECAGQCSACRDVHATRIRKVVEGKVRVPLCHRHDELSEAELMAQILGDRSDC